MKTSTDHYLPTDEIKVKDGLPRLRQDLKAIDKLIASLEKYGQLQPILINRDKELIAGGRRLAACIMSGRPVRVCYSDEVDPLIMREMELEENLQREDLTPAEQALGVKEIHELKQKIHGATEQGKAGGWTMEDTAESLGKSRTAVILDLQLATAVQNYPGLKDCKTQSEMKKAVKALTKLNERIQAIDSYEDALRSNSSRCGLINMDARSFMPDITDGVFDILLTDPPFGIDYDKTAGTIGGRTGSEFTTAGFTFEDDADEAMELYKLLAVESYRFCSYKAHGFVFVGPEFFTTVRAMFLDAGWLAFIKPIIWIKRETGQCNVPHAWPSSCYEMILYIRKAESRLVIEGKPDWIECDPVLPSKRLHSAEKPIPLLLDLLSRVSLPGQSLVDPFMGSGAAIEAGLRSKLICSGCDKLVESYATASSRIANYFKEEAKNGENASSEIV